MNKILGSCLCKEIKYEITGELESFVICHCSYCRKDTGSAFAANLFSKTAKIDWISGKSSFKEYNLPKTRHIHSFCTNCGSAVPSIQIFNEVELLVVPAGSLDSNPPILPKAHIHYSSRSTWEDTLPKIDKINGSPSN